MDDDRIRLTTAPLPRHETTRWRRAWDAAVRWCQNAALLLLRRHRRPHDEEEEMEDDEEDRFPLSATAFSSSSQGIERGETAAMRDGRLSIEHQLQVYMDDLVLALREEPTSKVAAATTTTTTAATISASEGDGGGGGGGGGGDNNGVVAILEDFRYVVEFRIKNGQMPHLDRRLCQKLAQLLLQVTARSVRTTFSYSRVAAPESLLAMKLFGEFIEEVAEFREIVSILPREYLRSHLRFDRLLESESESEKSLAIELMDLLVDVCSLLHEEAELVPQQYAEDVTNIMRMRDAGEIEKQRPRFPVTNPFLPQDLFFQLHTDKLLAFYRTSAETGLASEKEILSRRRHYGDNSLPQPPKPSVVRMLLGQITDFMVLILLASAIISAAFSDMKSASVLFIVVFVNVTIGFGQEFNANKALRALLTLSVPKSKVTRYGRQFVLDARELVPGDVVVLEEGDAVPADLRLIETTQLEIMESILTGESEPVQKSPDRIKSRTRNIPLGDCRGNAFMSTAVVRGRGKGVVVRVGRNTEIGRISDSLFAGDANRKTNLQRKLQVLGFVLVVISVVLCALITVMGILRGHETVEMVRAGLSLAVAVIPEGLVAVVTITMAVGIRRMAKRNVIVRNLPSVETLGSVTVICSDKTGTLTEGKMRVTRAWTADGESYEYQVGKEMEEEPILHNSVPVERGLTGNTPANFALLHLIGSLCNNASVVSADPGAASAAKTKYAGDPTEVAIYVSTIQSGLSCEFWTEQMGVRKRFEFPFESDRKMMSVLCEKPRAVESLPRGFPQDEYFVLVKGAPETIIEHSSRHTPLPPSSLSTATTTGVDCGQQNLLLASQGLRVLALAYRCVDRDTAQRIMESKSAALAERDLRVVGLVGMADPPRPQVKSSIATCKAAGIQVYMITGDHVATAKAIAENLGIIDAENSQTIRGDQLDILTEQALASMDPFPCVFARVGPDNKLKLIRALQKRGQSVAMTGDGVNDAPAIKAANIGVAMGQTGTEITKQSAKIIITDDNFNSIVAAVEEGRRVYDNIIKFIVYILSCNTAEIVLMFTSACMGIPLPFTPIMILWSNIIADIPPSLSLGLEPPEEDTMRRPPRRPSSPILSGVLVAMILLEALVLGGVALAVYLTSLWVREVPLGHARTVTFLTLNVVQILHVFHARSLYLSVFRVGLFGNRWTTFAVLLSLVLLVLPLYIPGLNRFLDLENVGALGWAETLAAFAASFLLTELIKLGARRRLRRTQAGRPQHTLT